MPFQLDSNPGLIQDSQRIFEEIKKDRESAWADMTNSEVIKDIKNHAIEKNAQEVFRVMLFAPSIIGLDPFEAEELVFEDISRIKRVESDHRPAQGQGQLTVSKKYKFQRHPSSGKTPYSIKTGILYSHLVDTLEIRGFTDLYIRFAERDDSLPGIPHQENLAFQFGGISPYQTSPDCYRDSDAKDFIWTGNGNSNYYKNRNNEVYNNNSTNGKSRHPFFKECNNLCGIIHNLQISIKYVKDNFVDKGLPDIYLIPGYDISPNVVSNARPCPDTSGVSTLIFSKYERIKIPTVSGSGSSLLNFDYGDRGQGCCP